jgi:hypothetical protein
MNRLQSSNVKSSSNSPAEKRARHQLCSLLPSPLHITSHPGPSILMDRHLGGSLMTENHHVSGRRLKVRPLCVISRLLID